MESDAVSRTKQSNIFRLKCSVHNYDWGIKGYDSRVARLFALNSGSIIDPDKPYAEFWMGTHDSGPSFLIAATENGGSVDSDSTSLKSWVSENPNVLGDKVVEKWGADIPFLFKVRTTRWFIKLMISSLFSFRASFLGSFCGETIVDSGSSG